MAAGRAQRAFRMWRRNFDVFKSHYWASIVGNIGEPLLYLFGLGVGLGAMVKDVEGIPYLHWLGPGLMAASAMNSAAFECTFGAYTRMAEQRVHEGILATPMDIDDVVHGEILWGTFKGLMSSSIMLAVLCLFGYFGDWAVIPLLLLAMALFSAAFSAITLCFTSVAQSYESFNFYFTLFLTPLLIFSGVYFPAGQLPAWFSAVFLAFPTAHAVNITRFLFHGGGGWTPIIGVAYLAACAAGGVALARRMVRKRLIPAP